MTITIKPDHMLAYNGKLDLILKTLGWEIVPLGESDRKLWYSDDMCQLEGFRNARMEAIDKRRVGEAMREALGYTVTVWPHSHHGLAVEKVLGHEVHGKVVRCPMAGNPERVYQRLVTNRPGETHLHEFRADVYGSSWIWSLKRMRKDRNGFPLKARENRSIDFAVDPLAHCTIGELADLRRFLGVLGMEYGSLDIIRDGEDNRLYVIDATVNTGIPAEAWHTHCTYEAYAEICARAFAEIWEPA